MVLVKKIKHDFFLRYKLVILIWKCGFGDFTDSFWLYMKNPHDQIGHADMYISPFTNVIFNSSEIRLI